MLSPRDPSVHSHVGEPENTLVRMDGDTVAEVMKTPHALASLFGDLERASWRDATSVSGIAAGWVTKDAGRSFEAPPKAAMPLADALHHLAAKRYAVETGGIAFVLAGGAAIQMPTDRQTQAAIAAAALHPGTTPTAWKIGPGKFVLLAPADITAAAAAILAHVRAAFAREATLSPKVLADTATDISGGWPA